MTDTLEKYRSLVRALHDRTATKTIKWRYESEKREVWAKIAGQYVLLTMSTNEDFEPVCQLSIENSENEFLEGFNDENLGSDPISFGNYATWYQAMEYIYDLGKRQATGADEALDNILLELKGDNDHEKLKF